jgi:hypothetical protein
MTKTLFLTVLCLYATASFSQSADSIINSLKAKNKEVTTTPCNNGNGMIVTSRALNVFFADKVGSYLSEGGDLSLFQNYATLNSSDGKFTINHNFSWKDDNERIRNLLTIGVKTNIADGFASVFEDKKFKNDLGITLKYTSLGKGTVCFDACSQSTTNKKMKLTQKEKMNLERAYILNVLEKQIREKAAEIDASFAAITLEDALEKNVSENIDKIKQVDTVKNEQLLKAYNNLKEEYEQEFAKQQAKKLGESKNFNLIMTHWTSISIYLPVTSQKYTVGSDFLSNFNEENTYPWEINLAQNWIFESTRKGRFFISLNFGVGQNNSIKTEKIEKTTKERFLNLPPDQIDTMLLGKLKSDEVYVGAFSQFTTPIARIQGVWFPPGWNVGISVQGEKSFGTYDPLNARIGIPVRLKNQEGKTNVNFELQLRMFDLSNSVNPDKSRGDKTSVGVSVGLPFTSILN